MGWDTPFCSRQPQEETVSWLTGHSTAQGMGMRKMMREVTGSQASGDAVQIQKTGIRLI